MTLRKIFILLFIFIFSTTSSLAAELNVYINDAENAPVADWLFFYPEPVYRLVNVKSEMHLNFQLIDVNSMIGIEGFYYLPNNIKTNIFAFWLTPTLNTYTLDMHPIPLFKINKMPAYITNWNSFLSPKSWQILDLKVPNQGPGLYSLYILATDNSSDIFGNISGVKSFERVTIEVIDPGTNCDALKEALNVIKSPEDIVAFYIKNGFYYHGSLECCLDGYQDACLAKSACDTLKLRYGMCQDFTVLNSIFLNHLGIPNKPVTLRPKEGVGHAVLVFLYKGAFYMFDNMDLRGPAANLKQLLDMNRGVPNWTSFFIVDSCYKLMEGRIYGPYKPNYMAVFITPKDLFY